MIYFNMNINTRFLKVGLRRFYAFRLSELYIVNHKKLSDAYFMSHKLKENDCFSTTFPIDSGTESSYFENVVLNNPSYQDIYFNESLLQENAESTNELVVFLRNLTEKITIRNNFVEIENHKNTRFKNATYTLLDLIEIFYLLYKCKDIMTSYNKEMLYIMLSKKCLHINDDNNYKLLTLLILMAHYNNTDIPYTLVSLLLQRFSSLTNHEIVAIFYILTHKRQKVIKINLNFAEELCSKLKNMTLDEVATIAIGCFRYKISFGSSMGNIMLDILVDNIENLNDYQVGAMSKGIYFMHSEYKSTKVLRLQDKVFLNSDKFTITTLIHLAKIKAKVNFIPTKYLDVLRTRLMKENKPRIKDIERFLLVKIQKSCDPIDSDLLNFIDKTILQNKPYLVHFPRSCVSLLHFLICLNVYKEDAIDYVFSSQFLKALYQKFPNYRGHELCSIDCSLELERPNYKGNRFPNEKRKNCLMKNFHEQYKDVQFFTLEVHYLLVKIFGTEYVTCRNLLPHLPYAHSVMCFNTSREPLTMKHAETKKFVVWKQSRNEECFITDFPKFRNCSWLVFVITSNSILPDGVNMNLMAQFKVRQFKALGLYPLQLNFGYLRNLTHEEKEDYVKRCINEVLDSNVDIKKKIHSLLR